jgi:hypothetical protein
MLITLMIEVEDVVRSALPRGQEQMPYRSERSLSHGICKKGMMFVQIHRSPKVLPTCSIEDKPHTITPCFHRHL